MGDSSSEIAARQARQMPVVSQLINGAEDCASRAIVGALCSFA
jgi:hypothetical protein